MPVHIADRVLQTDLIMARPNSRAQRHQNWPTQHEKKRSADQFMIDLPNQQARLPQPCGSALFLASTRASSSDTQTKGERRRARAFDSLVFSFHLIHLFIAQLEASKELTIIAGIEESNEKKNRDRLQELLCLVKPSTNTAKSKRLRESAAGEK
jgi:hypothetical protein